MVSVALDRFKLVPSRWDSSALNLSRGTFQVWFASVKGQAFKPKRFVDSKRVNTRPTKGQSGGQFEKKTI